jgi:signal recognition particle subunit SRP54
MFDTLSEKFQGAFKAIRGKARISEENIEEALKQVRTALLEADVHFKVAKDFINNVKTKALGEKVISGVNPDQQFIKIVQDELTSLMETKIKV